MRVRPPLWFFFFFFNDPPTTEIYPLPLHDALPILARRYAPNGKLPSDHRLPRSVHHQPCSPPEVASRPPATSIAGAAWVTAAHAPTKTARLRETALQDRKSTRLNSSHGYISYAVFC